MKRAAALVLCVMTLFASGCASILEDDKMSVSQHISAAATALPGNAPEASNYDELKAVLLGLVMRRAESGQIRIYSYEGDIHEDVERACLEVKTCEPVGAFALSDITASATQIVTYFEVEAELTYKRTLKQIESILSVQTMQYLRAELLDFMRDYAGEAAVITETRDITEEKIALAVRELYYQNPLAVVMLPSLGIEVFPPEDAGARIFELTFNYRFSVSLLASYNRQLRDTVSLIAGAARDEESDGAALLELARRLAESCVYNEGRAGTMVEHGVQSFEATAFGALVDANAVGEGYAMAYKALCDALGIECSVVLGMLDGAAHAWNIVALEGNYYHVDVAMCSKNGIETAFLLRDEDMPEIYNWDRQTEKTCDGELTYYDFVVSDIEAEEAS